MKMALNLNIETDNAAFVGCKEAEVASILRKVAKKIEAGDTEGDTRDGNGQPVGAWKLR